MRTLWKSIFFGLLLSPLVSAQDSALQTGMDALAAIQKITREVSNITPESMMESLNKMVKVVDGVDQESLCQSPQGVELLLELTTFKTQALRHQRKIAEARSALQNTESKLSRANIPADARAIYEAKLLILIQDLSFEDQNWKDLDRNVKRLTTCFDQMGKSVDAARQLGTVGVQLIRYLDAAQKTQEIEPIANDIIGRIQKVEVLPTTERMTLVGRLVDQVLDFKSKDANWENRDKWLVLADQAWKGLRDEKETPIKLLAGQLIAHRASLVSNTTESQSCWREYEDWLRRDSFASVRDPYVGREYIEANIQYLNRIEPTPFALHLIRTYQFLDEFEDKLKVMSKSPSAPGLISTDLVKFMRSQLDQGIASRKTAMNRPSLKQAAPPIDFQFIDDGKQGSLKRFFGKVIVLEFWNPHCGPCLSSFEWLSEFHRTHRERGLSVLGCSYAADDFLSEQGKELTREQSLKKFRDFLAEKKVDYPMVLASDPKVLHTYGVLAEPTFVVLDRQGKIISYAVGLQEFQSDACQSTIMKALER